MLTAGFIIIQVLHMARLGDVKLSDLTSIDRISNGFELATIDTLEPTGWGFRAYESLGIFPIGKKMDHFQSYFGSAVPRFLWPDKPFYSFEPDLTIQMTGNDISGNNPVRTFTIVAEGLLLGGYFGVVFICVGYAFFTVAVERYMTRFWEFTFIRYWWILMAVIMYRTSLFTLFSSAFILAVLPMLILGSVLRTLFISGETSGVAVPPGIRTELGIRPTPPLGMRGASQPIRRG